MAKKSSSDRSVHRIKKCPFCGEYLRLDDTRCTDCGRRVGPVNRMGLAKKPVEWQTYLAALIACVALGAFVWYFFFRH